METRSEKFSRYSEWVQATLEKFPGANPEGLEFIVEDNPLWTLGVFCKNVAGKLWR